MSSRRFARKIDDRSRSDGREHPVRGRAVRGSAMDARESSALFSRSSPASHSCSGALGLYAVPPMPSRSGRAKSACASPGAKPSDIVWLIARRAAGQVVIGLALGLAGAVIVGRLLKSVLVETTPTDPLTLAAIATFSARRGHCVILAIVAGHAARSGRGPSGRVAMDVTKPDRSRRKRVVVVLSATAGSGGAIVLTALGLSRLQAAAPRVDRSTLWIDTVKRQDRRAGSPRHGHAGA